MYRIQRPRDESFDICDTVLGEGLVLNRTRDGSLVVHAVADGSPRELGYFHRDDVAEAWVEIDAIDLAAPPSRA